MTKRFEGIVSTLLLAGALISFAGLAGVVGARQEFTRGALNGLPDTTLPPRQPMLGVNVDLTQYAPQDLGKNLDEIKATGFVWVRQTFDWSAIESQRGMYDWSRVDPVVMAATERHLRVIAVIWRSPAWVAERPGAPPGDMQTLGAYAGALAGRYRDQIDVYQIWDEPNLASGWGDQPADPIAYVEMLQAAYRAIHDADPTAQVLTAGLAPTIETGPDNLSDVLYLRQLYENGAAPYFDGVAGKPYGFDTSPDDRRVDPSVLNFSHFILLREEMERHGDQAKPLWASQFGWNALPLHWIGKPSIWGRASAADRAAWTIQAYERALTEWPWAGPLILENWQPVAAAEDPRWGFALKDQAGALTDTARAIAGFSTRANGSLWPGVYPADTPLASYSGQWEFSDLGADISQQGDSAIDVPFTGNNLAIIARRDNYRAYLYVTVDGQPSSALPRDEQGRAYALLSSADKQPHVDTLTLAAASDNVSAHQVHIQADRGWDQWAVVGFAVGNSFDASGYDLLAISLGIAGLAFAAITFRMVSARGWPSPIAAALGWSSNRLSAGAQLLLSLMAALAAWLGMAITWGGLISDSLRKLGDGPSLLIAMLTAGIFYASPWLIVTLIALTLLFLLIYAWPVNGLALIMFFTPYYLLPRELFDRALGMLEVTTLLTLAAWALRVIADRKKQGWPSLIGLWKQLTALDKAVLLFVGIACAAVGWSNLKGVAVTDLRQMVLEPAAMYLILRATRLAEKDRWLIIHMLMLTGLLVAAYGFYQFATDWARSPGQFSCLRGTFGTCNNAALYLTRLIPIGAATALIGRERRWRWLYGAAGILMIIATGLTVSRGGLLFGLPVALAVVVILWAGRRGVIAVVAGVVIEILAIIPLMMFVPRFRDMLDLSSGSSSSFFRTQVWQSAFAMLRDHPITGVGLDQFLYEYRGRYILPGAWQQPDLSQPHNFILNYWIRLGIFGLGIAVWLHFQFWRLAWKTQQRLKSLNPQSRAMAVGLMGAMATMIAHGLVDETHFVIDLAFIFFMSLGLMHQLAEDADGNLDQRQDAAAG